MASTEHPLVQLIEDSERPGWGIAQTNEWMGLVQLSNNQLVARAERVPNANVRSSKIVFDPDGERAALCSNRDQILVVASKQPLLRRAHLPTGSCSESTRTEFVATGQLLFTQPKHGSQMLSPSGTWRGVDSKDNLIGHVSGGRAFARNGEYLDVYQREACRSPFKIRLADQITWREFPRFALGGQILIIEVGTFPKSRFLIHRQQGEAWVLVGEAAGRLGSVDGTGRFLVVQRDDGDALRIDLATIKEERFRDPKKLTWPSESFILSDDNRWLSGVRGRCDLPTGDCKPWNGATEILRTSFNPGSTRYWTSTRHMLVDDDGRLLFLDTASNALRGALFSAGGRGWALGMPSGKSRYTDIIEPVGWEPDDLDWFACLVGERVVPSQVCWELFQRKGAFQSALTGKR